jgi:hypothetical protein
VIQQTTILPKAGPSLGTSPSLRGVSSAKGKPTSRPVEMTSPTGPLSTPAVVTAGKTTLAALTPTGDKRQADEALQHARLLILGNSRTALAAQANSSSQSVQHLLS